MSDHDHVRAEHYAVTRFRAEGASMLARRLHEHRLALCSTCRTAWDQLAGLQSTYLARLDGLVAEAPPAQSGRDDLAATPEVIRAGAEEVAELRRLRRRTKEELWELLRLPQAGRQRKIRRAHRRFRSRLLAEMLIDECRDRLPRDPQQAAEMADLVPLVLDWTRRSAGPSWAPPLLALAEALRADALRALGDRPEAEAAFSSLRRRLAERPLGCPAVLGEVALVESRLRVDQGRLAEALALLDRAVLAFRYAQVRWQVTRTQVERSRLMRKLGRPDEADRLLHAVEPEVKTGDGDLLSFVVLRVDSLCALSRFSDARQLLERHLDDFESSLDLRAGAVLRYLEGRIESGLGHWVGASELFAAAGEGLVALGRVEEAAFVASFEAEAYSRVGAITALRRLAVRLEGLAQRRDVTESGRHGLRVLASLAMSGRVEPGPLGRLRRDLPFLDRGMQ